jgi:ABC-type multidrug transport system fused ATPase/permease subunit
MEVIEEPAPTGWRVAARDPILTALAVLLALASFINAPLVVLGTSASYVINVALWLVIVAAVTVLAPRAIGALVAAVAAGVGAFEIIEHGSGLSDALWRVRLGLAITLFTLLIGTVGVAVFAPGRVTYHRILGAIVVYMATAYLFVALYHLLVVTDPNAFTGLPSGGPGPATLTSLIYFSYVTLTSTGYGDIAPVHPLARGLANLEAVVGQLYPAILLARLVSLHAQGRDP